MNEDQKGWDEGRAMRETPRSMAAAMANFLNSIDDEMAPKFVEGMACQHRTLQQKFTGLCFEWLKNLAALDATQYDLRNEASVEMARKIVGQFGDQMYLPHI